MASQGRTVFINSVVVGIVGSLAARVIHASYAREIFPGGAIIWNSKRMVGELVK
jgi:uncharacterized membrane protein YeaQ/YmgE (transglycosylase-associated protein family)